ncbi:hypothetical protein PsYK624_013790 [Phanerochaete sordida]|uniref:Pentacotripeptide-repeat region of PRORP domain-containing protein n=1 Tax=Phanerochaete sordida TaxID=48140 RepID=A0A9P3L7S7_9APHY|nr:hypothetical protein PsYK624_013790 [Phanerochaete sordida]
MPLQQLWRARLCLKSLTARAAAPASGIAIGFLSRSANGALLAVRLLRSYGSTPHHFGEVSKAHIPDVLFFQSQSGPHCDYVRLAGNPDDPPDAKALECATQRAASMHHIHKDLAAALSSNDLERVQELWTALKQLSPLDFMAFRCMLQYSSLIERLAADSDLSTNTLVTLAIDEIATFAAAVACGKGLVARMRHYLSIKDPERALSLFRHAITLNRRHNDLIDYTSTHAQTPEIARIRSSIGPRVRPKPESVVYALAACAMKDSFQDTFQVFVNIDLVRIPYAELRRHVPTLDEDIDLRNKTLEFVSRAHAAKMCMIPLERFRRHIKRMTTGENVPFSLLHTTETILTECLREDASIVQEGSEPFPTDRPYVVIEHERWALLIWGLICTRQAEQLERIWPELAKLLSPMPACIWAAVLDGFASMKRFDRAEATWRMLRSVERTPGPKAYGAYIKSLFEEGRVQDAVRLFDTLKKAVGTKPYPSEDPEVLAVFNTVLGFLARTGDEVRARKILDDMKRSGPHPNAESFIPLLRYHAKRRDLKAVASLFGEMNTSGVVVDLSTAAVLLSALYSAREDAISLVFTLLQQNGVGFDRDNRTKLIQHLVDLEEYDALSAAIAVLEHLARDTDLRTIPYVTFLCGLERASYIESHQVRALRKTLHHKLFALGRKVTLGTSAALQVIQACLENSRPEAVDQAMRYYNHCQRPRSGLSTELIVTLLQGLRRREEWATADTVVADIKAGGPVASLHPMVQRELELVHRRTGWQALTRAEPYTIG